MNENPWMLAVLIVLGLSLVWFWIQDYRAGDSVTHPHPLPGTKPASGRLIAIGAICGLALVVVETAGEVRLGITHEQSRLTLLFAGWTLIAAICEEIIFRGYIVVQGKGKPVLWLSVVAFSGVFAAMHPFVWKWEDNGLQWTPSLKNWFSTAFAFLGSIVFYALRFNRWNGNRSLLPCFAAHLAKNLGVVVIKAISGFVG